MDTRVWCRPQATEVTWSGFSTYDDNFVNNQLDKKAIGKYVYTMILELENLKK